MKPISRTDKIFSSPKFLRDSIAFSTILFIIKDTNKYPEIKVFKENDDCIVIRSDDYHPIIVWTSNDFSDYENLYLFIKEEFGKTPNFSITTKKSFYDYLNEKGRVTDKENTLSLGCYECMKANDIKTIGYSDNIKQEEVSELIVMLKNFEKDINLKNIHTCVHTNKEYEEKALMFLNDPVYRVWRDEKHKIVAFANCKLTEQNGKVSSVYTKPEARGKSYAKMLVAELTKEILKTKEKAIIYTNYNYPSSNRCYQAVGYQLTNILYTYAIK